MAAALAAAGHRVRVITDRPDDPDLVAPAGGPGSLHVESSDPAALGRTGDPPDLVHAIGTAAARAVSGAGVPVVLALPPQLRAPASDADVVAGAARVLAGSEDQHTELLRYGVPRASLRTVPACVDTDVFTPDGPALRRGDGARIVTAGPLGTGAGAGAAVRALARVPSAELLVGGGSSAADDPDRARLFTVARDLGVERRVRFLGPVGSGVLPRLLRSADVVVAAPGYDTGIGTVLQAMACSRPVVVSAVGALRDAVVDRVTGVHVRPGRPDDLGAAVRDVLTDDAFRTGLGIAGRDRAVSRFGRVRLAEALTAVYAELLGTPVAVADLDEPEEQGQVVAAG
ncbi:glycosyltransferase family 4 protein [Pseudonocardia sp. HH130630-07]|uniref:glycosyltransferase family 4 protein n=1 Tax=Pseudonocardia sp. HH130630-07 TaxID=1690815 RepID=UPI0008153938|nr:glycosyltransferase family 4 protein [Pseudonocardia sp. HH130630-07]ANY05284.1 hypothetical protein AFB00_01985 [Pseudonocardia sp. HH130630-07]